MIVFFAADFGETISAKYSLKAATGSQQLAQTLSLFHLPLPFPNTGTINCGRRCIRLLPKYDKQ